MCLDIIKVKSNSCKNHQKFHWSFMKIGNTERTGSSCTGWVSIEFYRLYTTGRTRSLRSPWAPRDCPVEGRAEGLPRRNQEPCCLNQNSFVYVFFLLWGFMAWKKIWFIWTSFNITELKQYEGLFLAQLFWQ